MRRPMGACRGYGWLRYGVSGWFTVGLRGCGRTADWPSLAQPGFSNSSQHLSPCLITPYVDGFHFHTNALVVLTDHAPTYVGSQHRSRCSLSPGLSLLAIPVALASSR